MTRAKVTSKGQITIPVSVRKKLGLGRGSFVSFSPHGETFVLNPLNADPLDELEGFFSYSGPGHSVEDMNKAINEKVKTLVSDGA